MSRRKKKKQSWQDHAVVLVKYRGYPGGFPAQILPENELPENVKKAGKDDPKKRWIRYYTENVQYQYEYKKMVDFLSLLTPDAKTKSKKKDAIKAFKDAISHLNGEEIPEYLQSWPEPTLSQATEEGGKGSKKEDYSTKSIKSSKSTKVLDPADSSNSKKKRRGKGKQSEEDDGEKKVSRAKRKGMVAGGVRKRKRTEIREGKDSSSTEKATMEEDPADKGKKKAGKDEGTDERAVMELDEKLEAKIKQCIDKKLATDKLKQLTKKIVRVHVLKTLSIKSTKPIKGFINLYITQAINIIKSGNSNETTAKPRTEITGKSTEKSATIPTEHPEGSEVKNTADKTTEDKQEKPAKRVKLSKVASKVKTKSKTAATTKAKRIAKKEAETSKREKKKVEETQIPGPEMDKEPELGAEIQTKVEDDSAQPKESIQESAKEDKPKTQIKSAKEESKQKPLKNEYETEEERIERFSNDPRVVQIETENNKLRSHMEKIKDEELEYSELMSKTEDDILTHKGRVKELLEEISALKLRAAQLKKSKDAERFQYRQQGAQSMSQRKRKKIPKKSRNSLIKDRARLAKATTPTPSTPKLHKIPSRTKQRTAKTLPNPPPRGMGTGPGISQGPGPGMRPGLAPGPGPRLGQGPRHGHVGAQGMGMQVGMAHGQLTNTGHGFPPQGMVGYGGMHMPNPYHPPAPYIIHPQAPPFPGNLPPPPINHQGVPLPSQPPPPQPPPPDMPPGPGANKEPNLQDRDSERERGGRGWRRDRDTTTRDRDRHRDRDRNKRRQSRSRGVRSRSRGRGDSRSPPRRRYQSRSRSPRRWRDRDRGDSRDRGDRRDGRKQEGGDGKKLDSTNKSGEVGSQNGVASGRKRTRKSRFGPPLAHVSPKRTKPKEDSEPEVDFLRINSLGDMNFGFGSMDSMDLGGLSERRDESKEVSQEKDTKQDKEKISFKERLIRALGGLIPKNIDAISDSSLREYKSKGVDPDDPDAVSSTEEEVIDQRFEEQMKRKRHERNKKREMRRKSYLRSKKSSKRRDAN